MLYFTNSDLADTYHVSVRAVRYWITQAKAGKLDLALHSEDGKTYVANTSGNIAIIERIVEVGKKRRNSNALKVVTPQEDFYRLYTQSQIYNIATNLELHHEIPREYNYFDRGADAWDAYAHRLDRESAPNTLNMTRKLLALNQAYIDDFLARYKRVNIVDIGVGNALPVKELLAHLLEQGKLGRYVATDISPEMLNIAERNIKEWFGDKVPFERYALDINREGFANMLAEDYVKSGSHETGNLILFLGATIQNFRNRDAALRVINDSMSVNDWLVHTQKLDTAGSRNYFDFSAEPGKATLAPNHRFIFDLLNIEESFYEVDMGYNPDRRERYIRVRLKMALSIKFEFEEGERVINLNRGDAILLWRASQDSALDVVHEFDRNDFYILQTSQSEDREYMLTISQLKRD